MAVAAAPTRPGPLATLQRPAVAAGDHGHGGRGHDAGRAAVAVHALRPAGPPHAAAALVHPAGPVAVLDPAAHPACGRAAGLLRGVACAPAAVVPCPAESSSATRAGVPCPLSAPRR